MVSWLRKVFWGAAEVPSPSDVIPENNIRYDLAANLILISLNGLNIPFTKPPKVWIPPVPDTGSMDPATDFGHNNILIAGADEAEHKKLVDFLKVGDIIVYQVYPDRYDIGYALHRIIQIERDKEGRYFYVKGDNNIVKDSWKIRDSMLKWLVTGAIF